PHPCPAIFPDRSQNINVPDVLTNPYTAQAADTKIVIPIEERVVLDYRAMLREIFWGIPGNADETADFFQLATAQEDATAFLHGDIGRTVCPAATLFLGAGQAGVGMVGQQLAQSLLSAGGDLICVRVDNHPVFGGSDAGVYRLGPAVNLDQA
ncbi:unnamed protein product, partial [marine sediment metagenome]